MSSDFNFLDLWEKKRKINSILMKMKDLFEKTVIRVVKEGAIKS